MNINDILDKLSLYDSKDSSNSKHLNIMGYFNTYYLPIKKYLLYKLINNYSITELNNIVEYFLSLTINSMTTIDINFKDSLENKTIANILLSVLNDSNVCHFYNTNQIIILDNIELFNKSFSINKITSLDNINESSQNANLSNDLIINNIKLLSTKSDLLLDDINLNIIDNIYYLITNKKNNYYTKLYEIINNLSIKNIIEIKKRIREIKLILNPIYKIVIDDENIEDSQEDFSTLLSMTQVILIIKTKIDNILKSKNIILIVSDNLKIYKQNIEDILEKDPKIIKELLKIFNYSEDQIDGQLINSEIIEHILNILENYYKIHSIIRKELKLLNDESFDIIVYLEELYEEYENLNEMLENYLENSIDTIIHDFIINLKQLISLDDIIELMKDLIEQIKNNNNVLILDQRLLDLKKENNPINNNEMIKLINNKQNINIICSDILKSLQINDQTYSDEKETEYKNIPSSLTSDVLKQAFTKIDE
jgi:hypothetical protein